MKITMIAAVAQNYGIGKDGGIPWRVQGDQAWFKDRTWLKPVLMGYCTWFSIPSPLRSRLECVVSHNHILPSPQVTQVNNLWEFVEECESHNVGELIVIGGESVYRQVADVYHVDEVLLTRVDTSGEVCDRFFPAAELDLMNREEWLENPLQHLGSDLPGETSARLYQYLRIPG